MRTLTLAAQIRVVENNTSPDEANPRLDFYLSGHFVRERISVPLTNADAWQPIRITGLIAARACPVPENAALCIHSFAERLNDGGIPCVTDAGTASISMGDLVGHNFEQRGPFLVRRELLMRTVDNYVKSVIEFRIDSRDQLQFTSAAGSSAVPIDLTLAPCLVNGSVAGTELVEYQRLPLCFVSQD